MPIFASFIIFLTLYLIGRWQREQRWCNFIMLKTAPMKASMDRLKLEMGKRLLPVMENFWRDVRVLTEFDL